MLYSDEVIRRFRKVLSKDNVNLGDMENPDTSFDSRIAGCVDHLFLYLKINKNIIEDIKFRCHQCDSVTLATADILCDIARGKKLDEISDIRAEVLSNALGLNDDHSFRCAEAIRILNSAISDYKRKSASGSVNSPLKSGHSMPY